MITPLAPAQLSVLRVRAALFAAMGGIGSVVFDRTVLAAFDLPFGLFAGPAAVLLILFVLWSPRRRYRSWGYAFEADELHIQSGVWTRTRTVVPFGRVQHIDVTQGPVERRYGVGTLVLHTAGTRSSAVDLPGLEFEEAGRMRDEIRAKIRQDLT